MAWLLLILAGLMEIGFTTCLKLSHNFTDYRWGAGFILCSVLSFLLLNKAIQTIPIGVGYAVWTGIGAVGTVLVSIIFHKEPMSVWKLVFIFMLVSSIVGLKVVAE